MATTSKVAKIYNTKKAEGQYGTVFYFSLEMENGEKGSIGKKTEDGIKVGQELTYEIKETQYGNQIKEIRDSKFAPRNPKADFIICAMECATNLSKNCSEDKNETAKEVETWFDYLYSLMQKKYGE